MHQVGVKLLLYQKDMTSRGVSWRYLKRRNAFEDGEGAPGAECNARGTLRYHSRSQTDTSSGTSTGWPSLRDARCPPRVAHLPGLHPRRRRTVRSKTSSCHCRWKLRCTTAPRQRRGYPTQNMSRHTHTREERRRTMLHRRSAKRFPTQSANAPRLKSATRMSRMHWSVLPRHGLNAADSHLFWQDCDEAVELLQEALGREKARAENLPRVTCAVCRCVFFATVRQACRGIDSSVR